MKERKKVKGFTVYVFHVTMGDKGKVFPLALDDNQARGVGLFAEEVNSLSHKNSLLEIKATPDLPARKNRV